MDFSEFISLTGFTNHNLEEVQNFCPILCEGFPKVPLEMHGGEAAGISCEGRTILSKLSPNVFPR